jgi:hypothetical protein
MDCRSRYGPFGFSPAFLDFEAVPSQTSHVISSRSGCALSISQWKPEDTITILLMVPSGLLVSQATSPDCEHSGQLRRSMVILGLGIRAFSDRPEPLMFGLI